MKSDVKKHYCSYPFTQVTTTPTGLWKLCCSSAEAHGSVSDYKGEHLLSIKDVSLKKWWSGDYLKWVRQQHLANKPIKECEACAQYEEQGAESYRQRAIKELGIVKEAAIYPESLDLKLGNRCNAACLFCDPSSSSRIMQEWQELGWDKDVPFDSGLTGEVSSSLFSVDYDWPERPEFWESIQECAPYLKNLKFTGGEPLINNYMLKFLKYLVKNGYAQQIRLQVTTNGIVVPKVFLELTREFREVQINFSVDGFYKQNEYIRYPTKWIPWLKNIENTLSTVSDNTELYFQHSISAYSVFGLVDLFTWLWSFKRFKFHLFKVYHPEFQQTEVLDKEEVIKVVEDLNELVVRLIRDVTCPRDQLIVNEINGIIGFLKKQESKPYLKKKLRDYVLTLDKKRGLVFKDYIPEAAASIGIL